ncbi:MAG TPA: hypothetical protein VF193_16110 [Steroidobacter sp.]
MEFLLQWVDELDDALGMLRHLAPRILGLLLALGLFLATGFALLLAPAVVLPALALVLSFLLIVESVRRRRARVRAGN